MVTSGALQPGASTLDTLYPVGSALTFPVFSLGGPVSGITSPEFGAVGAPLVAFDQSATEGFGMPLGTGMPNTWQTFNVYFECFNFNGAAGNVVWRVNLSGGGDIDTTVTYASTSGPFYNRVPSATTFTLDSIPVAGVTNKGGGLTVSRVGGAGANTLAGDINMGAVILVRVT